MKILEKEVAPHSVVLSRKFHGKEELGRWATVHGAKEWDMTEHIYNKMT